MVRHVILRCYCHSHLLVSVLRFPVMESTMAKSFWILHGCIAIAPCLLISNFTEVFVCLCWDSLIQHQKAWCLRAFEYSFHQDLHLFIYKQQDNHLMSGQIYARCYFHMNCVHSFYTWLFTTVHDGSTIYCLMHTIPASGSLFVQQPCCMYSAYKDAYKNRLGWISVFFFFFFCLPYLLPSHVLWNASASGQRQHCRPGLLSRSKGHVPM